MGKSRSIVDEAKESVKNKHKEAKAMENKSKKEAIKTFALTVLVTLIVSAPVFTLIGINYQKQSASEVQKQVKDIVSTVQAETPSKQ